MAVENLVEFKLTEGRARALAVQNQRMEKGLESLTENWEDWSDALQETNKGTVKYTKAARELTKAIGDLVGAEEDLDLSKEFFESAENMEYLQKAAEGDIDAVNRLGIAVAQDLVKQLEPLREYSGLDFSDADSEQAWANMVDSFNQNKDTVITGLENLQQKLDDGSLGGGGGEKKGEFLTKEDIVKNKLHLPQGRLYEIGFVPEDDVPFNKYEKKNVDLLAEYRKK